MMVGVESEWLSQLEQTGLPIRHCLIGRQPEWHHHVNFDDAAFRNIRRQLRRARNKDVQISHIDLNKGIPTPTIRAEIEGLLESWKATRTLDTIGFMVAPELNVTRRYGHLICARRNGVLVGLLSCLPTPGHNGWFLEDLIRAPEAPNGTIELLIAEAFTQLPHPPKPFITLGMVPLHDIEIFAQDNPSLNWVLNQCRVIGQRLVNLKGLAVFKARFRPDTWNTMHLVTLDTQPNIGDLLALGRVLANGSMMTFFYRSFLRRLRKTRATAWRYLLLAQLSILIPWTVLLSLADGDHWFGSTSIQWAWVTFDVMLAGGLSALLMRLRTRPVNPYAWILGGATMADTVLSIVQALSLHHEASGINLILVYMGVLGPILATLTLFTLAWVNPSPVTPIKT